MAQIKKKFITADAVDGSKIRLDNAESLRARNAANSADVNILSVDASDKIVFASVPQVASDASAGNDLVRYSQLAGIIEGIKPKQAVVVASTADIDLSVAADPGAIDGHALVNNDRILLKDQTAPAENGIYVAVDAADPTSWVRSDDFNATSEIPGAFTAVQFGTLSQGMVFVTTSTPTVLNTDPIVFVSRPDPAAYTGGDMITISSNVVSVDLATVSALESTNPGNAAGQLRVKLEAANPSLQIDGSNQLGAKLDAAGAIASGASGLAAQVDDSTIEIATNALQVKAGGITNTQVSASAAIAYSKLDLATSIVNADISASAAIAYSKLDLATSIVNADISASAAIAYSKLDLAASIVNADISASAAIAYSKLDLAASVLASDMDSGAATSGQVLTADGAGGASYATLPVASIATQDIITLSGTDITNQYVDLAHAATGASASVNSISLAAVGGPEQLKAVDYTVALTGGVAGVTRITFAGDLATAGASELIAGDILMISYSY